MKDKLFFFNFHTDQIKSYGMLINETNEIKKVNKFIYSKDYYEIFLNIIASIINNLPITLLDYDLSEKEVKDLLPNENLDENYPLINRKIIVEENLCDLSAFSGDWELTLYTSGTTGIPKKVTHTFNNLARMVKVSAKHENDIWGLAYNPTHIAGLQVFFQALFNNNSIINLFGLKREDIHALIENHGITNISATPTFYRLLLPTKKKFEGVRSIASGGEKFDVKLKDQLKCVFPNAKIMNIYASTEVGSLFACDGDIFEIKKEFENLIKITDNEIYVHKNLLGKSDSFQLIGEWYCTGDQIEVVNENPFRFRIIGRRNEMINIGGYKVNPSEVEEVINSHPKVILSKVYSKTNSVLGNILIADIQKRNELDEKELRKFLLERLQAFKVPRIINFSKDFELTRTGKLKRT